jgi:hypothetical protein
MPTAVALALSDAQGAVVGAAITAVVALAGAIYVSVVGRKAEERNRRRDLYSRGYRSALGWCEAIYRVRRRASDGSEDRELVKHFHAMQEEIAYYQGWLAMETPELGRAYRVFVKTVLAQCAPLLQDSWAHQGREPTEPTPETERHPDITAATREFERDMEEHLSRWPWVRGRLKNRYPKEPDDRAQ